MLPSLLKEGLCRLISNNELNHIFFPWETPNEECNLQTPKQDAFD